MDQQRILVVEENNVHRLMCEMQLQQAGYAIIGVDDGAVALDLLSHKRFDLLITDLSLPTISGRQLIAAARTFNPQIAVIIVSETASQAALLAALNQQVHRYLLKPVSRHELLSNVAQVLAHHHQIAEQREPYRLRHAEPATGQLLCIGPLQIDRYRHRVTHSGAPVALTRAEFSLLLYFAQRRGAVISHQEITRDVLQYTCSIQEARDLCRGYIHRLRRKIEPAHDQLRLIHNVRGVGYRLLDDDEL